MPATKTNKKQKLQKIEEIYKLPLTELINKAQEVHKKFHNLNEIQFCTLSSIKTGACPEDCNYCSQSSKYNTDLKVEPLIDLEETLAEARAAKANGSTRFCMGAAWRQAPNNQEFDKVLSLVREVQAMNMEPCVTLGMLSAEQARQLKEAGLHSYNHNIDTSPEYYQDIIATRTFEDRLDTISNVQEAGIEVCTGGILGLGETEEDRFSFLEVLATLKPAPSSIPINVLVPIKGTPQFSRRLDEEKSKLEDTIAKSARWQVKQDILDSNEELDPKSKEFAKRVANKKAMLFKSTELALEEKVLTELAIDKFDLVRTIATARILVPTARIRLSAGRIAMSEELQTLCFLAGANSIHTGAKLLTTPCNGEDEDHALIDKLGLTVISN